MGYMLDPVVQDACQVMGAELGKDDDFCELCGINHKQLRFDVTHLFGLLQSATKGNPTGHIIKHKESQDGLLAWIDLAEDNKHSGSKSLKSEEMEELVFAAHDPRAWKTVASHIGKFQAWVLQSMPLGKHIWMMPLKRGDC